GEECIATDEKRGDLLPSGGRKTDYGQRRLLRVRGERPRSHRAATEERNQLFGSVKYKNCNRHGNPDANTKTCPHSNPNANVSHRCTDTCTKYNTNEYAQRQSSYAPASTDSHSS